jgi:hypothetical protein
MDAHFFGVMQFNVKEKWKGICDVANQQEVYGDDCELRIQKYLERTNRDLC